MFSFFGTYKNQILFFNLIEIKAVLQYKFSLEKIVLYLVS